MDLWLLIEILTLGTLAAFVGAQATGALSSRTNASAGSVIDEENRQRRRKHFWFRTFEPCVEPLADFCSKYRSRTLKAIRHGLPYGLRPAQQLAIWHIRAAAVGTAAGLFSHAIWGYSVIGAALFALVIGGATLSLLVRAGKGRSLRHKRQIQGRLPYVLELMSLLMDAGGTDPDQALRTAAEENQGHPIGELLNQLVTATTRGSGLAEAIVPWAEESGEEDLIDVAVVIRTSEERGTELDESLRALAEQCHVRRIERLEQAAEEARVHISWPGFLVLIGCMLIAGAPLVLTAHEVLKDTPIYSAFTE